LQALFQFAQHLYEKREGSGSIPLTYGSGSVRAKKTCIRLRIQIPNTGCMFQEKRVMPGREEARPGVGCRGIFTKAGERESGNRLPSICVEVQQGPGIHDIT
jgi:hypothetical protein